MLLVISSFDEAAIKLWFLANRVAIHQLLFNEKKSLDENSISEFPSRPPYFRVTEHKAEKMLHLFNRTMNDLISFQHLSPKYF